MKKIDYTVIQVSHIHLFLFIDTLEILGPIKSVVMFMYI